MNNFDTVFRGYDKNQVKTYLDKVISEYDRLLNEKKQADKDLLDTKEKLDYYKNIESTLNRAIFSAENAGNEIKRIARIEAESMIDDAKKNANRIINDALMKAELAERDTYRLRRNTQVLKRKLKSIIESQLEIIDEMDKLDIKEEI